MLNNLKIFVRRLNKFFLALLVLIFGLIISYLIRNYSSYTQNNNPFGLRIDSISMFVISVVALGYWVYGFYCKASLAGGSIIVGILGNSLEKVIWGSVADYIPFVFSVINHFDIMIWLGLVLYIFNINRISQDTFK